MDAERKQNIGTHVVEEYWWNGALIVYVDNHLAHETFSDAVFRLRNEAFDKAFERHSEEQFDERERQWLHDMGQGA